MATVLLAAYNRSIASELEKRVPGAWNSRQFEPNEQQCAIIRAIDKGSDHVIVQARAGSGKTATLMLVLPYVAERPAEVTVATTHSYGLRCWKQANPSSKIKVDADKISNLLNEMGKAGDQDCVSYWAFLRKLVSYAKLSGIGTEGAPAIEDPSAWQGLIDAYDLDQEVKGDFGQNTAQRLIEKAISVLHLSNGQGTSVIDFDDMTYLPLLYRCDLVKYDLVLTDEIQDLGHTRRLLMLGALRDKTGRMTGVGDRRQAIYRFSGADSNSMDLLSSLLKTKTSKSVTELPLNITYRCPKLVVALAQHWVPDIQAHESAPEGKVSCVAMEPKREGEKGFWDCGPFTADDAILCRNTRPLIDLAYQFYRKRIPAMMEGREIGAGLITLARKWKLKTLSQLSARLEDYRARELAKFALKKQERKAAELEDKIDTLHVLIQAVREEGKHDIEDLILFIQRMFGDLKEGEKPKCVTLCTSHRSKGREWKRVFILGRDTYMPSKFARKQEELEQEENLIYVSVTRAMSELIDVTVSN